MRERWDGVTLWGPVARRVGAPHPSRFHDSASAASGCSVLVVGVGLDCIAATAQDSNVVVYDQVGGWVGR